MSTTDYDRTLLSTAHRGGLDWIDNLIQQHKNVIADLERNRDRYLTVIEQPNKLTSAVDVLSWTMNSMACLQSNCRLDLLANHVAAITSAQAKVTEPA